jgi:cytochrome c-type protein NapB
MMGNKRSEQWRRALPGLVGLSCLGVMLMADGQALSVETGLDNFDHQGKKLYMAADRTPEVYLSAESGDRNLAGYYDLRQYPGSPPRIPHKVDLTVGPNQTDCLACHAKGGYSPDVAPVPSMAPATLDRPWPSGKFVPVTPHPEYSLCYQCHVPLQEAKPFAASSWQSIDPPRLGLSFLAGSPPVVPHSLQLRENCIACHTGPGAVTEIRVSHASRGNCRQCHVPAVQTEEFHEFKRQ